ncbi:MAG: malonyl-CoA decarboxylase family protein [Pseudomonadales bacterium]|nr:malonyl-CoA decarboxylase family protein [Pseudomonadales bacterium]
MNASPLQNILRKLSAFGLDSLDIFNARGRDSSAAYMARLCSTLLQLKGEASSIAIAQEIISSYQGFSDEEKQQFFQFLHDDLSADDNAVNKAIHVYQQSKSQQDLQGLHRATESPRKELFRALNTAPGGTHALIAMREDLLGLLAAQPHLKIIDFDLLQLFKAWFNRGFLQLRHIDWQTPAQVLEKLIEYESVHEIQGWPDLRRRLEDDRRCFAFFHPVIPDVPLIFVEVALTGQISTNIEDLLRQPPSDKPQKPKTAIFYSINNCLLGLRGVSFGNFLIKQVIEDVAIQMPSIKVYATLSPVPGFLTWLRANLADLPRLTVETRSLLQRLLDAVQAQAILAEAPKLQELLIRLCAHYLVRAKSRDKPADPVARFHLGNGASLANINWLADVSDNGMRQSAGIMVNYLYTPADLTRNHEAYEQSNKVVCSSTINKLLSDK